MNALSSMLSCQTLVSWLCLPLNSSVRRMGVLVNIYVLFFSLWFLSFGKETADGKVFKKFGEMNENEEKRENGTVR